MDYTFSGKFTASAAEASGGKDITIGCKPTYIKIVNFTADDSYEVFDIDGVDMLTTVDGTTGTATDIIVMTETNTIVAGARGFNIPASLLAENDVVYYIAFR